MTFWPYGTPVDPGTSRPPLGLNDVDDLGVGDPAWVRPGIWPAPDVPARARTVQTAARVIAKSVAAEHALDAVERAVVGACVRMGAIPPELA
ncbi:hypothetical protein [Streptomyces sp. TP-A0356]|uniref:hypothetical protein n=1 Tax=Streptomyces sp. TP-A0356 TaxID=1359208 RepID=UPI0006E264A9